MKFYTALTYVSLLLAGCGQAHRTPVKDTTAVAGLEDSTVHYDDLIATHRFIITGDFDGDGRPETLTEHFMDLETKKELRKYWVGDSMDVIFWQVAAGRSYSFISCDNPAIDTFHFSHSMGADYLKNEGDLDGDGTDELSYVPALADYSSLNTWHILTYKDHHWKEILDFPIWESQLPYPSPAKLDSFSGWVRKIKPNYVEVIYRLEDGTDNDTVIVNLKHPKKFF